MQVPSALSTEYLIMWKNHLSLQIYLPEIHNSLGHAYSSFPSLAVSIKGTPGGRERPPFQTIRTEACFPLGNLDFCKNCWMLTSAIPDYSVCWLAGFKGNWNPTTDRGIGVSPPKYLKKLIKPFAHMTKP